MQKKRKSNNALNAFSHKGVLFGASAAKEILFVASAEGASEKFFGILSELYAKKTQNRVPQAPYSQKYIEFIILKS